eukprot:762885-Amorphochlora_amoeboformis.AAC.2
MLVLPTCESMYTGCASMCKGFWARHLGRSATGADLLFMGGKDLEISYKSHRHLNFGQQNLVVHWPSWQGVGFQTPRSQ